MTGSPDGVGTDTIVARATAPGRAAVALIRLSGAAAIEIAAELSGIDAAHAAARWRDRRPRLVSLRRPGSGERLDRALATFFPAPASYTGEDVVEISTHGGFGVPLDVVEACVELGARRARAGEFTQRAYLLGKVDLTQAEAVRDLIETPSARGRSVALHQLERGLARRVSDLRRRLIGLSALLAQHIDFPEEDDPPTPLEAVAREARAVAGDLRRMLATAPAGEALREGALTVLAGPPNSGKSSLFNALIGTERALVTDVPGTTRDALEAVVEIDGFPFRLIDTAGLRAGADVVERLGIEVARRYLAQADVALYCREARDAPTGDASRRRAEGERREAERLEFLGESSSRVVTVRTKCDRLRDGGEGRRDGELRVSARTGHGIDDLKKTLRDMVFGGIVEIRDDAPVVTVRRQAARLEEATSEVEGFAAALDGGVPPEVAAAHLKSAETALEEILGVVATDDVLDRVFRDFCVGK